MRVWLAARATGIVCYLLLVAQVVFGLILSHPTNQTTWKLSKRLFPWHENLWIFVLAFLAAHIVSLLLDPFAGVGRGRDVRSRACRAIAARRSPSARWRCTP